MAPRPHFSPELEDIPLKLPDGKMIATALAVARAPDGTFYILHQVNPPGGTPLDSADRDVYLPQIVHVSANGEYLDSWGGPDHVDAVDGVSQWPKGGEGLECDADGNLWLFGYMPDDHAALKFSPSGELLLRIGERGKTGGDADPQLLGGPTSCYHDTESREVFFADGYTNHRVISFNSDTGEFMRMWGAYGKDPASLSAEEGYGNPVHKVMPGPDGHIYVCDRIKNRVQEFEVTPGSVRYLREVEIARGTQGYGSAFDLGFAPGGEFVLVGDGTNGRIWIIDRQSLGVVGWTKVFPATEGDDNMPRTVGTFHRFLVEPTGDILMACTTNKLKRLKYLGIY